MSGYDSALSIFSYVDCCSCPTFDSNTNLLAPMAMFFVCILNTNQICHYHLSSCCPEASEDDACLRMASYPISIFLPGIPLKR